MAKQTKEVAVIEKLEELKDYATQAQNPYLLGRINRIMQEIKTDEIAQSLEPLKEEHVFEYKSNNDEDLKMVSEILENYHEEDVHEVATAKTDSFVERMIPIVDQQNLIDLKNAQNELLKEVTWESIWEEWIDRGSKEDFLDYLREFYNAPTKKQ